MSRNRHVVRGSLVLVTALAATFTVPLGAAHAVTAPGPITNLKVFTANGLVTLTWNVPSGAIDTVVRARIGTTAPTTYDGGAPDIAIQTVPGAGNVTWVDGLDPGTDFSFSLFAAAGDDNGTPNDSTDDTITAVSTPVSFTVFGSDLSMAVNHSGVGYGSSATFTARLVQATSGVPITSAGTPSSQPQVEVDFYVRLNGVRPWSLLAATHPDTSGRSSVTFAPGAGVQVEAEFFGFGTDVGATSNPVGVAVTPRITEILNRTSEKLHQSFTVKGAVTGYHLGSHTVHLQQYSGGGWHDVRTASLTKFTVTGGGTTGKPHVESGSYTFTVKSTKRGTFTYRVQRSADTLFAEGHGKTFKVKVH